MMNIPSKFCWIQRACLQNPYQISGYDQQYRVWVQVMPMGEAIAKNEKIAQSCGRIIGRSSASKTERSGLQWCVEVPFSCRAAFPVRAAFPLQSYLYYTYAPLLYADLYYTRFLSKSLVLPNTSITRQITSILRGPLLYAVFSLKSGTPDYRV